MLESTDINGTKYTVTTDFAGERGRSFTVYGPKGTWAKHDIGESMTHAEIVEMVSGEPQEWCPDAQEYGDIVDINTGNVIRKATKDERDESAEASKHDGGSGAISVDDYDGTVYVAE